MNSTADSSLSCKRSEGDLTVHHRAVCTVATGFGAITRSNMQIRLLANKVGHHRAQVSTCADSALGCSSL